MTTQALPASAGWQWLKESAKFTIKNPILVLWVLFTHLFSAAVAAIANYSYSLGPCAAFCAFCLPILFVVTISVYRGKARGEVTSFVMYFAPWIKLKPLFRLSLLCALMSVAAAIVYGAMSSGTKAAIVYGVMSSGINLDKSEAAIIIFVLFLAVFSFPSLLVAFQEWNVTEAIKHGFFIPLKNWRAFLVNVASWIMLIIICIIAFIAAFSAVTDGINTDIFLFITLLVLFCAAPVFLLAIFFANCYQCYVALFPEDEPVCNDTSWNRLCQK